VSNGIALEQHRSRIWWLCYRMTGVAADADDLVQETFARALERPPADVERDLGPWLTRVATNAARDLLRRRKSQGYRGTWLPSPVDTEVLPDEQLSPQARYSQLESLSFAFLIALEALTPNQRAVLILRDVLDYSVEETAAALELSASNVKTTHHRARESLRDYDAERLPMDASRRAALQGAMTRLLAYLAVGDAEGAQRVLSEAAVAINDGNGEFFAAQRPVTPGPRVARFLSKLMGSTRLLGFALRELNGQPAIVMRARGHAPEVAEHSVTLMQLDSAGRIARVYSVVATRKLAHLALSGGLSRA
jgi:RNA polymerase sigma-70 factor (ECF subfamily)